MGALGGQATHTHTLLAAGAFVHDVRIFVLKPPKHAGRRRFSSKPENDFKIDFPGALKAEPQGGALLALGREENHAPVGCGSNDKCAFVIILRRSG